MPRGRRSFTPTLLGKGQVFLDFRPLVVHEIQSLLAAPFNPLRGPFRPSRLSRQRRAQAVSLLSDECPARQTDAATTPSADFRVAVNRPCGWFSRESTTRRGPPEVSLSAFAAHPPNLQPRSLMDVDFAISCSLVRPELPRIRFLYVRSRFCSTLPSDDASRRRPCASLILHLHQVG